MRALTTQEKKAASILQHDLPLISKPFAAIADACGLSAGQLIRLLKDLSKSGILRKIGAILRHQNAGYRTNALVVWSVPPGDEEVAGRAFASLPFVSHCYEREPAFLEKYNLFTMLHAHDNDLSLLIDTMTQLIGSSDYLVLESLQEYKKTSPEYF